MGGRELKVFFTVFKKENNMAKNREKQRAHLKCGMTKEERLIKEAAERREALLDLTDSFGLKDPTPYQAVKNMYRRGELSRLQADPTA